MRTTAAAILAVILASPPAQALEWRLGLSYASGVKDIPDLYEDNLRNAGFDADVDLKFPIGVSVGATYDWESGLRADVGAGPAFFLEGDVDYFELPLTATMGYNFAKGADFAPYVRGGLAYHIGSGDFYESADPGLFAAAGLDFRRLTVEVAADTAKVKFERTCPASTPDCSPTKKLSTYDIVLSVFWRFY